MQIEKPEILIAVIGRRGIGKTTFINLVSGSQLRIQLGALPAALQSSPDRDSAIKVEVSEVFQLYGRRFALVDNTVETATAHSISSILTPEFHPIVVLDAIITMCRRWYGHGQILDGIIYLNSVDEEPDIIRNHFFSIRDFCGDMTLRNIAITVIGHPNWDSPECEDHTQRLRKQVSEGLSDIEASMCTVHAYSKDSRYASVLTVLDKYLKSLVSDAYIRSIATRLLTSQSVCNTAHIVALRQCQQAPSPYVECIHLCSASSTSVVDGFSDLILCTLQELYDDHVRMQTQDKGKFARRILVKISQKLGTVPSTLFMQGISFVDSSCPSAMGGYADVFRGARGAQEVALKRLRRSAYQVGGYEWKKSFIREALLWRQLRHENILELIGLHEETFDGYICMVSPWMVNRDISSYIADHDNMDVVQKLAWITDTTSGLRYLHEQGVVHGDLRGANILLDHNLRVHIADFGLSMLIDTGMTTQGVTTMREGAVRWMAPEVIDSGHSTTESDVYSLGCVFLEIFSEAHPFPELRSDNQVISRIVRGERPVWQTKSTMPGMAEAEIAAFTRQCWTDAPSCRPVLGSLNFASTTEMFHGHDIPPQVMKYQDSEGSMGRSTSRTSMNSSTCIPSLISLGLDPAHVNVTAAKTPALPLPSIPHITRTAKPGHLSIPRPGLSVSSNITADRLSSLRVNQSKAALPLVSLTPVTSERVVLSYAKYGQPNVYERLYHTNGAPGGTDYGTSTPGSSVAESDARSMYSVHSVRTTTSTGTKHSASVSNIVRRIRGEGLSREYWMDDQQCMECCDCQRAFTTWRRRHHCRICGQIYCSDCASNIIKGSRFERGGTVRVCNLCLDKLAEVEEEEDDSCSVIWSASSPLTAHQPGAESAPINHLPCRSSATPQSPHASSQTVHF